MSTSTLLTPAAVFFLASSTHVATGSSMIGTAFLIAFGGIVGLFVLIFAGICATKCIIRKYRARKIKRTAKRAEKQERADLEKARREYENGGTNRLGPIVGEVIDIEINGHTIPPPTHTKHDSGYGNENRSRKTLQQWDSRIKSSPEGSKGRNNWLWWRRMEMTPRGDIEQGASWPRVPSPGENPPSYTDGGRQNLQLHRVQAWQGREQQGDIALREIRTQRPGPLPIQPLARMPTQTQTQTAMEKTTSQDIEDDKSPNILVAFWDFLRSWARVEREQGQGRRV